MSKSPDAFRTISEVAEWLGVQAHVLRFWESKFSQVKPVKRAGGRRYYRPADMQLLGGIRKLLHEDGLTIKGAQKILREQGVAHVSSLSHALDISEEDPTGSKVVDSTVVPFQTRSERPQDLAEPDMPPAPDLQTGSETEPERPTEPPVEAEPDFLPGLGVESSGHAPDKAPEPAATAPVDHENPRLPSFLSRSRADSKMSAEPEDGPPPLRARVIDAPDPPADNEIEAPPGPITRLSALDRLSAGQMREIAPVVQDLRAWITRTSGTHVS